MSSFTNNRPGPAFIVPLALLTASVIALGFQGCSWNQTPEKMERLKREAEEKKARHAQLVADISSQTLTAGTSQDDIRNRYGDPDDVFASGSSVSSFDIWTYEKVTEADQEDLDDWRPVRLYFNSGRLSTWKY